jgi:hypothetical protein
MGLPDLAGALVAGCPALGSGKALTQRITAKTRSECFMSVRKVN